MSDVSNRQDRKAATPSRRSSVQGQLSNSPNAGTVVFRPSPTQSPAAAQTTVVIGNAGHVIGTVIGPSGVAQPANTIGSSTTGTEFNTTQIGSNNISLQNKVRTVC